MGFDFGHYGRIIGLKPGMIFYIQNTADIYNDKTICMHVGHMTADTSKYNRYRRMAATLLDKYYEYEEGRKAKASPLFRGVMTT